MKKAIIIILSIIILVCLGFCSWYLFFSDIERDQNISGEINNEDQIEVIGLLDLSDSGLDREVLPEVSMDLGFDENNLDLNLGEPLPLISPEIDLESPAVPKTPAFTFDSSGLEDALVSQQSSQVGQTEAAQEEADQAAAEAAEKAEEEARADEGVPADSEETTPPVETPAPPAQTGPGAAECAQFDSAPSCSYVPANVRDICGQCKAQ